MVPLVLYLEFEPCFGGFFQSKNREFKPNRFQIPVFYKKIAAGWLHQFPFAGIEQTFAGPHSRGEVDASVYNTFGVFIICCNTDLGGFSILHHGKET